MEAATSLRHAAPVWDAVARLRDRCIPGSNATIEELAITAAGVFLITAHDDTGRVERRFSGGWLSRAEHLYVGGRDRTSLLDTMAVQRAAVASVLADEFGHVPVVEVLCFTWADWSPFAQPLRFGGVLVVSPHALAKLLHAEGPLSADELAAIEGQLVLALPPA